MNKDILAGFIQLMADEAECSTEWLLKWLELYYQLRRAKERAEAELKMLIYPPTNAEALSEAVSRAFIRPSPADAFIRSVADPAPEDEAPPPAEEDAPDPEPAADPLAGFEAVEVKSPAYLRGTAARKFKRDTRERLEKARKERNLSLQAIAAAADGLRMGDLLGILECALVGYKIYVKTAQALDALGA